MRLVMNISDRVHVLARGRTLAGRHARTGALERGGDRADLGVHGSQEAAQRSRLKMSKVLMAASKFCTASRCTSTPEKSSTLDRANGAGKTTLLHAISGVQRLITEVRLRFEGSNHREWAGARTGGVCIGRCPRAVGCRGLVRAGQSRNSAPTGAVRTWARGWRGSARRVSDARRDFRTPGRRVRYPAVNSRTLAPSAAPRRQSRGCCCWTSRRWGWRRIWSTNGRGDRALSGTTADHPVGRTERARRVGHRRPRDAGHRALTLSGPAAEIQADRRVREADRYRKTLADRP